MSLNAREVTQRFCRSSAKQIVSQAIDAAEGKKVSTVNVSFAESATQETIDIFVDAFSKAAQGTELENTHVIAHKVGGGMPGDEAIYFENVCFEKKKNPVFSFLDRFF